MKVWILAVALVVGAFIAGPPPVQVAMVAVVLEVSVIALVEKGFR